MVLCTCLLNRGTGNSYLTMKRLNKFQTVFSIVNSADKYWCKSNGTVHHQRLEVELFTNSTTVAEVCSKAAGVTSARAPITLADSSSSRPAASPWSESPAGYSIMATAFSGSHWVSGGQEVRYRGERFTSREFADDFKSITGHASPDASDVLGIQMALLVDQVFHDRNSKVQGRRCYRQSPLIQELEL